VINLRYVDLSEYTSRRARYRLVQACLEYYGKLKEKSRVSPTKALAGSLGVSQRTVQRWARGGIQSCNVNAETIIHTALILTPQQAIKILLQDFEEHHRQLVITLPPKAKQQPDNDTPLTRMEKPNRTGEWESDTSTRLSLSKCDTEHFCKEVMNESDAKKTC